MKEIKKIMAELMLLRNLTEQAQALRAEIAKSADGSGDTEGILEAVDAVQDYRMTPDEAIGVIAEILGGKPERPDAAPPTVEVDPAGLSVTVSRRVDGGTLISGICDADFGTAQAVLMYRDEGGDEYDLAMAEVKRGELALSDGKPEGNRDVDLYVWADPLSEGYTSKHTLRHEEFCGEGV